MSKTLLIAYHSQSGASARLAVSAQAGARQEPDCNVELRRVCDTGINELATASGLLLVAAENSGQLNGGCKDFLDRVFYPAISRELVMPYSLIISAGNDGRGAVTQVQRILSGIPFTAAAEPLILRGEPDEHSLARAAELGQGFAAGLEMGIF